MRGVAADGTRPNLKGYPREVGVDGKGMTEVEMSLRDPLCWFPCWLATALAVEQGKEHQPHTFRLIQSKQLERFVVSL
jgi:hypothetical protein